LIMEKHVLGLALPTDPRWVDIAGKDIEAILVDHAYCEQKAASSCISLIVQYPEKEALVRMLVPVVAEEWSHFERVLAELGKRGFPLGSPRKDDYVEQLLRVLKKGGTRDAQLVERLLMNALIEARSCERFRLLSLEIQDEGLRSFYHELMISEAGHYRNFLMLAKTYVDPVQVERRWREWLAAEADIVRSLRARADRMH
jgi:tRNA-(ms[2]io[6]A)-hydroxylase